MAADSISSFGRDTQGVRLMRVCEGSRVISIARTEKETDEDEPVELPVCGCPDGEEAEED